MPDEISDEELRELLAAARPNQGRRSQSEAFERIPMAYDFTSPQQINKDRTRYIDNVHEQFARLVSSSLASSMRVVVDVELAFTDQTSYNEFLLSLPNPCTAYSFIVNPPGGGAILNLDPELVMAIIERTFGGKGQGFAGDPRALTQIETNIIKKLVLRLLENLEAAWEGVAPIRIDDVALEINPEFIQVAAPPDQVILVAFEANSTNVSGLIHLCYPLTTLHPLLPRLPAQTPRKTPRTGAPGRSSPTSPRALRKVKVPVVIQLARGSLPLEEVANLQIGDIIKLDTVKSEPAVVFIGERPKFLGRPGLQGKKRAVKILGAIGTEEEDLYG